METSITLHPQMKLTNVNQMSSTKENQCLQFKTVTRNKAMILYRAYYNATTNCG